MENRSKHSRSRRAGAQSKYGCFRCRERRVKCDEEKPKCRRCLDSGYMCDGYPNRAPEARVAKLNGRVAHPSTQVTLHASLRDGLAQTATSTRLANVTIQALSHDAYNCFGASASVLCSLLPQLNHRVPSVHAAAVCMGNALLTQAQPYPDSDVSKRRSTGLYLAALRTIQTDLSARVYGPVPILLASLLLAGVEILIKPYNLAFMHFRGAFELLKEHKKSRARISDTSAQQHTTEDHVELFFRGLAVHFTAINSELLSGLSLTAMPLDFVMSDLDGATTACLRIFYATWPWLSRAIDLKYSAQRKNPNFITEQSHHISTLTTWLEIFERSILPQIQFHQSAAYVHALALRIKASYILIQLGVALSAHQTSYDSYALHFQRIIRDAEAVLAIRKEQSPSITSLSLGRDTMSFHPGPTVAQPLLLAANKYRQPQWRRKAISLLAEAGQEGQLQGSRESVVAMRSVQLEEGLPAASQTSSKEAVANLPSLTTRELAASQAVTIPEKARLHFALRNPSSNPHSGSKTVKVVYRRYDDLDAALACSRHRPWGVREIRHHVKLLQTNADFDCVEYNDQYCETWTEDVTH